MRLSYDKLLLPIILLPSANLALRFLIDAVILLPFTAKLRFRLLRPYIILLFLAVLCLFGQSLYSSSVENLFELARVFPLIMISIGLSALRDLEKIPSLFFYLLVINLLVVIANYTFSANALVELGFNNAPFYKMYGRNTGALAFTGTAGFLSFINLYFLLTSKKQLSFRIVWMFIALANLAVSGSKTYMLTGLFLCVIYFILKAPAGFRRPKNMFSFFVITSVITGTVYALLSKLKFQVLYQVTRVGIFLSTGSLSSFNERFEKIEMFLDVQNENLLFHLIGTPKELLENFGGTFDNDYLFFYVRLGAPLTFLLLMFLFVNTLKILKSKFFFEFSVLILIMVAAFTIPVLTDPQSSFLVFILIYYILSRANEQKEKRYV